MPMVTRTSKIASRQERQGRPDVIDEHGAHGAEGRGPDPTDLLALEAGGRAEPDRDADHSSQRHDQEQDHARISGRARQGCKTLDAPRIDEVDLRVNGACQRLDRDQPTGERHDRPEHRQPEHPAPAPGSKSAVGEQQERQGHREQDPERPESVAGERGDQRGGGRLRATVGQTLARQTQGESARQPGQPAECQQPADRIGRLPQ